MGTGRLRRRITSQCLNHRATMSEPIPAAARRSATRSSRSVSFTAKRAEKLTEKGTANSDGELMEGSSSVNGLEELPSAVLATILAKLDVSSICSVRSTCRTFRSCASHVLSFLPCVHLLVCRASRSLQFPLIFLVQAASFPVCNLCMDKSR